MVDASLYEREVIVKGHLIDSLILTKIIDRIIELGGDFRIQELKVGKYKADTSYARMIVKGRNDENLKDILEEIHTLGAVSIDMAEAVLVPAPNDMVFPDNFYSTTNNPTQIFFRGEWVEVENTMMDKVIVLNPTTRRASCRPIREVRKGDLIVVGEEGVRVQPPERPRESMGIFKFMSSSSSSEKPAPAVIRQIAIDLYNVKRTGGKVAVVAGPAVVHTGAAFSLASLIREGYVDVLLSGNALAVHDVEAR